MKIFESFKYCPNCAAAAMGPGSSKSLCCGECGFEFFFNPAAAVAGLCFNEAGHLLVTLRASDPGKGLWDLPGGFIDADETAEAALAREIREELDLDVDKLEYFASAPNEYIYKGVTYLTLDMAFICHVSSFKTLTPRDEIADIRFVPLNEVNPDNFAFESTKHFIEQLRTIT